ncbi:MAG: hypothetical protein ACOC3V_05620 [bacterium]
MKKFNQLCVWSGTILEEDQYKEFVELFKDQMGVRVKVADVVTTNPDLDSDGNPVKNTGGRSDVLFYVHDEDISKFSVKRLKYGIRWWEDVTKYNNQSHLYPKAILDKYSVNW